jgi:hypothetical protein
MRSAVGGWRVPQREVGAVSGDDLIDRFVKVFRGRADVYGSAKGFCVKEPLTRAVFERHLMTRNPENHIGVYCMVGDMCSWGCIDIDGKDFVLTTDMDDQWDWQAMWTLARNLHTVLAAKGVPAHIERSKNGYHVWVFPMEPLVSAATMRRALMAACTAIGYSPKEVNPKAEGPRPGTKGYGNFVRLPYGGAIVDASYMTKCQRVMVDGLQASLWLEDFLDRVDHGGRAPTERLGAIAQLWTPPPPPRTEVDYDAGLDAEQVIGLLDGLAYTVWLDGPLPGGDRSSTLARLAHLCAERGITATQAFTVLKSADERWGKFYLRDDCDDQLARLIQGAYE